MSVAALTAVLAEDKTMNKHLYFQTPKEQQTKSQEHVFYETRDYILKCNQERKRKANRRIVPCQSATGS